MAPLSSLILSLSQCLPVIVYICSWRRLQTLERPFSHFFFNQPAHRVEDNLVTPKPFTFSPHLH